MIYCKDITNILKEVYNEAVIGDIDLVDIKQMLSEFSYKRCKILVNGNTIMKQTEIINAEPLS